MIQKRKIHLVLSSVLLFALLLAFVLPFAVQPEAYAAPPVVPDKDAWVNTYSGSYYNNLNTNLTGTAFRTQLAKLIQDTHTTYTTYKSGTYSLQNVWAKSDVDPKNPNSGQWKWFYTGTLASSSNVGGSVGQTNREHVWAKNGGDTFTAESGPGADAHHLRPTECQMNSSRGNLGFDEVPQTSSNAVQQNRSTSYGKGDTLCYKSGSFFYPAKGYRGATARILFYMQVHYGDQFNLDFVDGATNNNGKNIGKISTLMKWHLEEPPNEDEIYRNNVVAGIQGNRNPFIDHPEYAEMIYCNNGKSYSNTLKNVVAQYGSYLNDQPTPPPVDDKPTALTLSPSSLSLEVGEVSRKISVTATPSNANDQVNWSTNNGNVVSVNNGVVTAVGVGSATVTATSVVASNVKATVSVTVTQAVTPDPPDPPVDDTPTALTLSATSFALQAGDVSQQIFVTAIPSGASNVVSWSTSDSGVAIVNNGIVTAIGAGTATITATSVKNGDVKASLTVTVTAQSVTPDPPNPPVDDTPAALTLSATSFALQAGDVSQQIFVTAIPSGASNVVSWSTSDSGVAIVNNGIVTAIGAGTATITATSVKNSNVKASLTVTVTAQSVTPDPPDPPDPPTPTDTTAFKAAVDVFADKSSLGELRDRYQEIKRAIDEYLKLNDEAKATVTHEYEILQAAIDAYNDEISQHNGEFVSAMQLSSQAVALGISAVLLAMFVIVSKWSGR